MLLPSTLVSLLWALQEGVAAAPAGAHYVYTGFTITARNSAGPRWCEALLYADEKALLYFDCESRNLTALSPLGEEVDAATREMLAESLADLMGQLRAVLLDLESDMFPKSGPLSLQGTMLYQVGADGQDRGSLWLSFQRQEVVSFQWEKQSLTVHSGDRSMEQQWKEASDVTDLLKKIFPGELKSLMNNISKFLNKISWPTAAAVLAPGTGIAPPNSTPTVATFSVLPWIWITPVVLLVIAVIAVMLVICYRHVPPVKERMQRLMRCSTSDQPACSRPIPCPLSTALQDFRFFQQVPSPAGDADGSRDEASDLCHSL